MSRMLRLDIETNVRCRHCLSRQTVVFKRSAVKKIKVLGFVLRQAKPEDLKVLCMDCGAEYHLPLPPSDLHSATPTRG